jgi:hypothetical protein
MEYKSVYQIIKDLENTPGTNDKLAILKLNENYTDLKRFFELALNPHIIYGIRNIPAYVFEKQATREFLDLADAMSALDKLVTREKTGNGAIDHLTFIIENVSHTTGNLIKRIVTKDPMCKVGYKLVNKVWKKLIPVTPYMRCSSANDKNYARINFPAVVDKKANGLFLNAIVNGGIVTIQSRNGKNLEMHGALDHEMLTVLHERDFVLMGEGLVLDPVNGGFLDRSTGNGIINKAIQGTISQEEASRIVIECWDVVPYRDWVAGVSDVTYDKRRSMLESMLNPARPELSGKLMVIESKRVNNFDEANEFYRELLARGEEGAVIKNLNGIWKNHTSPNQVKMKVKDPADLMCVGTVEHKKEPGWIGALLLESSDGIIKVKTGSGLTEDDRQRPPEYYIGHVIEMEYNEVTIDKKTRQMSLFLPIYVERRLDKDEADDFDNILERSCMPEWKKNDLRELKGK